jgi:hypothetical protein
MRDSKDQNSCASMEIHNTRLWRQPTLKVNYSSVATSLSDGSSLSNRKLLMLSQRLIVLARMSAANIVLFEGAFQKDHNRNYNQFLGIKDKV